MRVGITATRKGLTPEQRATIEALLVDLRPTEAHHGDCVGGDAAFHDIVRERHDAAIHVHPPSDPKLRAWCDGDVLHEEKPYLARNRDIVAAVDVLIAAPREHEEPVRTPRGSGTWFTAKLARAEGKRLVIVYPGGWAYDASLVQSVAQTPVGDREEE